LFSPNGVRPRRGAHALMGDVQKSEDTAGAPAHMPFPLAIGKGTGDEGVPFRSSLDGDEDLDGRGESWLRWSTMVASLVALWWTSAVAITLIFKRAVGSPGARHAPGPFPYPFALTSLVNIFTAPAAWALSRLSESRAPLPPPPMGTRDWGKILLIGCLQGAELGLNNKAIEFLPVSMKTMMHSMFVLFVMVTAWFWNLERLGYLRAAAALCIVAGGVLQGLSAEQRVEAAAFAVEHAHGVVLMLVAMVLGAQRWALIQVVVHSSSASALGRMSKLQFAARTLPVAGLICFALALVFETHSLTRQAFQHEILLTSVPGIGAAIIILTISELSVVSRTSAVALQVLATLHQIPIVFVSAAVYHERVRSLSIAGFALCVLAAFIYAAARRSDSLAARQERPPAAGAMAALDVHADVSGSIVVELMDAGGRLEKEAAPARKGGFSAIPLGSQCSHAGAHKTLAD